jgi:acyl-CoA synthetase (AMP-forming)/AMP-acid ligase II
MGDAAPTPLEVLEFFHAIGIPVGELWGMSETCGVVTLNPPDRVKLGTVGPPIPGYEVKLADDGEVLVRGPGNMAGYRNLPAPPSYMGTPVFIPGRSSATSCHAPVCSSSARRGLVYLTRRVLRQ